MVMTEKKEKYGVLPAKLGGGPHGLGDPNDRSLRKVEIDVMIPKKIRDRTRNEKCVPEVEEFTKCCKEHSGFMIFKCKRENSVLKACLARWYHNKEFVEECTQQYLDERSEYRRTGIPQKRREMQKNSAPTTDS